FTIDEKVEILLSSDTPVGICKSIGLGLIGLGEAYDRLKPDIVLIMGDRFEAFAAASAALVLRIPIAHLYGGEATFGAMDEAIRHSITKMSHFHFTSTEKYRKRVIQLGENPERVFNVGAVGLDNIKRLKLLSKKALEKELNFKFNKHNLLVTFHPVTLENNTSKQQFRSLLNVLDTLKDTNIIFTYANADTHGRILNTMIEQYIDKRRHKSVAFSTMGQLKYLSTMQFVNAVVGNSSSAIVETPSFKIGTINIGDRQKGRIKPESVIDCQPKEGSIRKAFKEIYSKKFQENLKNVKSPFDRGVMASLKIKEIVKNISLDGVLKKEFYDICS
ncbi:MAG: UDP-N-acetylglucosamine 2-epimerase (hydrolyzing), partial [Candidatus Omnitrophica bacterium]|nr:UDP-N-acetylglucosamine 2-epimerase (hydrolyzing) [Candidatus Omnitrophota bacterium]